jgi:serine/threonine-protein kinase RsbW
MDVKDRLVIDSRFEAVSQARDWLAKRAVRAGFPSGSVNDLKLALTEAVTNIVRYAYDGEPGHEIILSLLIDDDALTVVIRDFGRPFDGSNHQAPNLNASDPQENGYGIFLIKRLMDEVHYDASSGTGTTLTLVKQRAT